MFTGIITETGTVASVSRSNIAIRASAPFVRKLRRGASVAVDGACLTVVAKDARSFTADIMPETQKRTALGALRRHDTVNLELPATPSSFLSGHIVQGHIDGIGTVKKILKKSTGHIFSFSVLPSIARYIVPKGSVAIQGVSLTVISVRSTTFTVGVIPHTLRATAMRRLVPEDTVNIEVDVLAKYAERFAQKHTL
ncbi:MAG TPA: riboflavin synthase [Candidatus Paceibacterota bacterium]